MTRKPPFGISNLSGLLAAVWVVAAWLKPDLTYHLAPVFVAGAFPLGHRLRVGEPLNAVQAFATFVVGFQNDGIVDLQGFSFTASLADGESSSGSFTG